jgi:uncharacterized cupin superfamily protein
MPRIPHDTAPTRHGTGYPVGLDEPCLTRRRWRLGDAAGLTQFGVNLLRLPPGQWSAQRHWHAKEDEFVQVLSGEVVLIEDEGETVMHAGDSAGFPAGRANGHHFVNRSGEEAVLLEVGSRVKGETCEYPDVDLFYDEARGFLHKDGTAYPPKNRR